MWSLMYTDLTASKFAIMGMKYYSTIWQVSASPVYDDDEGNSKLIAIDLDQMKPTILFRLMEDATNLSSFHIRGYNMYAAI